MSIEILSQEVINQIAAGEVLERPANLVKELIENSIDANATEIEVDLDLGGRYIKIQDNGQGMDKKDLLLALGRHSTSKIRKFADLWSLKTYGFRGEALASTAAVSQMQIVTRPQKNSQAFQISSQFGKQSDIHEVSGNPGTQIIVEELFTNVPARLKFLKSDAAEVTQITKVIKAFALTHPEITFRLKQKGVLRMFYPKTESYLERAKLILETPELYEAVKEFSNIKARVIFSSPQAVNKTAQNLWIFAQKRWIQDRGIQRAILDSYRNLLMHGEYPYCVVFLECDPQTIDVNIHPTKSQVKFQDASQAFRVVHNTLREALEKGPWLKNLFQDQPAAVQTAVENFSFENAQNLYQPQSYLGGGEKDHEFSQTVYQQKAYNFEATHSESPAMRGPTQSLEVSSNPLWGSLQVLGQLNLTYILAQSRQALFLVDQHAAHERVAFERLMKSFKEKKFEVQNFLLPLQMDLEPDRLEVLLALSPQLKEIGLEIEAAGPLTISVNSAPAIVKEKAATEILQKMSYDALEAGGSYSLEKKISDVFASMACHSVVRAGQALSNEEMKELLIQMDEFPLSSFCPHGRPVFKQITFRELDKEFGRIV
jgi:DNA mismatch repair protein MutL